MVVFISTTAAIWIVERICMDQEQDQIDNQRPQIYQGEFVIMTEEDFDPTDMKIKNEIEDSVKAVIQRIYGKNGPIFTVTDLKKGCMHVGFIYETNEESQAVLDQIEKVLGGAKLPGKVSNISINNVQWQPQSSSDVTQVQIKINIRLFRNKLEEMLKVLMQYHGNNLIIIVVVTIFVVVNTGIVFYPPTLYTVYIWTAVGITLAGAGAWVSDAMGTKYAKNNIIQYGKEVKDQLEEYEKEYRVNIEYSVNILSFKMIYEEIESDNLIGEEVLVHLKEIILPVLTLAPPPMITTLYATVASIIAALYNINEMRTDIVTRLRAFIESISFSNATTIVILSPVPIGVAYAIYTSVCEHPSIEKVEKLLSETNKIINAMK